MSVGTLLADPKRFFANQSDDPSLLPPLGVILLLAVVSVAGAVVSSKQTAKVLPPDAQGFSVIGLITGAIGAFVGAFIIWLVYASLFHGISSLLYHGTGSFRNTLAITGWGTAPKILGALVSAVATYYVYSTATRQSYPQTQDGMRQQLQQIQHLQNDPILIAATIVGIAITIWCGALWTFGLADVRDLELREAGISVGIPVFLSIAFSVLGLVGLNLL